MRKFANTMTMKKLRGIVVFSFFFLSTLHVYGQKGMDFQSREMFEISKDLTKDLEASIEVGQRFKNNSLHFDRSLITGALVYDLPKGFSLGAGARYILVKNRYEVLESKYRLHGDLYFKPRISVFQIKLRNRIQYGFDDINLTYGNKLSNRCRIGIEYDIFGVPLSVYTSYEIYLVLNDPSSAAYSLNKVKAGLSWDLPKRWKLNLYYLLEDEVNTTYPQQAHIVVAALGLKL